ncbi:uncharacterized protein LOC128215025 [Mya arenaria]|uniref:uncharacterized protein LOC128215025 n=1 Tax=Mya arenaria TaxID=6604 RepID=UPI0022E7A08A|nr:uncharacterized protein LOC128215025 [Mya arenaria]
MGHTLFFILALVAGSQAGPIQEIQISDKCARQCTVSNQFNYEPGTTYEFTYETDIRTAVQGASEDHAGVHLTSKVYLDFASKCEMIMRLSDVKLSEHDPETSTMKPVSSPELADLEKQPLTVSFQDGTIEDLCLSQVESDKTLNIKRGILSLIQNNMDDITKPQTLSESDVAGTCETEYSSQDKGWYKQIIKKSKNLLGCTERHNGNSAVQGIPYQAKSGIQSIPIVKSTQECEQEIAKDTGRLNVATCREKHAFVPFSRQDSGAITHSTQTLTYVKEYASRPRAATVQSRTSLKFEHSNGNGLSAMGDIENKLTTICDVTSNGVTPETPKMFTSLVLSMKSMSAMDMNVVYKKIKTLKLCSSNNKRVIKFFMDAVPMTGTTESVKFMTQLITSGDVSGIEAEMWMTSLAFLQQPSVAMLNEVKDLLKVENLQEKAMLSVSSLVHSVCRNNPACENYIEVKKIISLLESKIAPSCSISGDYKMSLLALRAIGNAGFGTNAISTLEKCFRRTENPIEIRLSAIEAFRRIPCSTDKPILFEILGNTEEDSEVRIAAYKSIMECASDETISKVKIVLSKESVNQVGSYIWSHLTNLMETSDPHKQSIRSILEDDTLKQEFNMDKRKFSRNYEGSLFLEKINTGATVEGDLIWSSKSFIPRSGMFNLTVDLFGNAINLFEIGGRVEGLEYFLESYFGPNGYFSEKEVKSAVDETAVDLIKADKVSRIDKRMESVMDDLRGSLYMRVFGNELRYMNFKGLDSLLSQNSFNFLEVLMKLSNENDYQFTHSTMFIDSTIVIPTSSGFPLNLTVNGSATIDMKASGMVDVMKMASSPRSLDIHGIIRPSAAVVVSSVMGIDVLSNQVGVKMISTLHSSSAIQGKMSIVDGSILTAEFDLPDEKMDIISVKSEFYTMHRESERLQKMITSNRQSHSACSGPNLVKVAGLEICAEMSFPNASLVETAPYFPITGPMNAGITLYKRDIKMTGYKLEARSTHNAKENIVRFAFSTPNSKIDRALGVDFSLNKEDGTFDASIASPWKKGDFRGTLVNSKSEMGVSGRMNWDNTLRFNVNANLKLETSGPGRIIKPTISIDIPNFKSINMKGSMEYRPWTLLDTQMTIAGLSESPIVMKSEISNKDKGMRFDATLTTGPKSTYTLSSSLQKTVYKKKIVYKPQISIRTPSTEVFAFGGTYTNVFGNSIDLNFVLDKVVAKPVSLSAKWRLKSYRRGRSLNYVNFAFESTPMYIKTKGKFDNRNMKTLAADIDLTYIIKGIARDNVKFASKLMNWSTKTLTKARLSMNAESKKNSDLNFKLITNVNHNKRTSGFDASINYGPNFKDADKQITVDGKLDRRIKSWSMAAVDFSGKMEIGTNFRLVSKVTHSHNSKALNSTATLRLNKNAMESNLQLQDESTTLKNLNGIWRIDIPGKKILMTHALKQSSENSYDLSSKVKVGRSENTFDASWKTPSAKAFTVSSNVQLDSMTPLKLEGDFNLDPAQYKIGGEIMRGSSKYSAQLSSEKLTATSVRCLADIVYPTRHIIGNFESSMANGRISSRSDLRWNADRDDSQRITVSGSGQYQDMSNMDGSLTVQYPSRTVSVNVKQTYTNKYLSHMDLKWGVSNSVSIDTVFGSIAARDGRDLIGSVKLSTPIQQLKSVELSLNHKIATTNYNTQVDLKFDTDDSISAELKVQRPINIRNIDAVLIAKAPSYGLKSSQANLQHSVTDGVSTVAKFNFNKQFLNADIHLTNNGNENDINLKGQLNFKSSMQNMKKGSILLEHSNNGRDVNTNTLLQYNNKEYGLKSTITATMNGMNIATDGNVTITLPSNGVSLTWNHRNTKSNMQSTSELILNGNQYSLDIKSIHDMSLASGKVHSTLQINTPYRVMKETVLQIIHEHRSGHFDSVVNISNEGMTIVTVEGKYERSNNQVKSKFTTSNSLLGDDVSVILNADYSASPSKAHLELSISPSKIYSIDGTYRKETSGDMDISISANTPNNPAVILYGSRFVKKTGIESKLQLQYMSGKNIQLDSFHNPNEISLKFSSPFTSDFATNAMYKRTGNTLTTSAKIDAEPLLGAWLVSASFDINERLSGNVKLTTPIASVPYSQITFVSYMVDNKRQSSLSVEYLPGKTVRLDSKYSFQSVNDLAMSLEFSSPFDQMPYARVSINHVGDLRRFSNNGEIEYQRGKVMSIETRYSGVETKSGSLIIRSPFYEDISASFNYEGSLLDFKADVDMSCTSNVHVELKHKGNFKNFESSSHILVDNTKYGGSLNFKSSPGVEASLAIETPIRNARFSASHKGPFLSFSNQMELSVSDIGVFSSDFNVDLQSTINLSAIVKTPIRGFSDLRGSLTHEGYISKFQTQIELQRNQDIYFASTKVNTEPAFIAETLLKTPYKALREARISISQEGVINNFKFHGEMQLNKDITELDLNVDATKKIDVDFTLRSPYTDTIKATFDHWGKLSRFQSKLRASAGSKRLIANAKFQMQPTVNALFTVKSPISWLKSHQLSLKHSGTADSFKCNLQYKCNGDTYIGDATFQNLNSLKGELTVKGPSFSTIKASVNHEGKIQNFKSSASVSMGKDAVEANINMNTVNGLKGGIAVATPFYGYKNIQTAVVHSGDLHNFKSHGEFSLNKKSGTIDISFDSTNGINGKVTMINSFNSLKDLTLTVTHNGDMNNFNTIVQCSSNKKSLLGEASFKNGISKSGSVSLKSTLPGIDNYAASFSHEGDMSKFTSSVNTNCPGGATAINLVFDSSNGIQARLTGETPMTKKAEIVISHVQSDTSSNSDVSVRYDGVKQFGLQSDLTIQPTVSAIVSVITPLEGYESSELQLHHNGNANGLRSNAAVNVFGKRFETEIELTTSPDIQGSFKISSPLAEELVGKFIYEGSMKNFKSNIDMTYGGRSGISVDMSFNIEDQFSGDLRIISPHINNLETSFTHKGDLTAFVTDARVIYAGQKSTLSMDVKTSPTVVATFTLTTPMSKDMKLSLSHTGPCSNSHTSANVQYGTESLLSIDSRINHERSINVGITITSVLPQLKIVSVKVTHDGIYTDFASHAEVTYNKQNLVGDLSFKPTSGSFILKTPFFKDITASFDRDNANTMNGNSNVNVAYGVTTLFAIKLDANLPYTWIVQVQVPVNGYETSELTYRKEGEVGGHFTIDIAGQLHGVEAYISKSDKLGAVVSITSPSLPYMSSKIEISGTLSSPKCHLEGTYITNTVEADLEFNTKNGIYGILSIKTPFTEPIEFECEIDGTPRQFTLDSSAKYGKEMHKLTGSVNTIDTYECQINIRSPRVIPIAVGFKHDGELTNFKSHGEVKLDNDKHSLDAGLSIMNDAEGFLSIESPMVEPIQGKFSINLVPLTYKVVSEVKIGDKIGNIEIRQTGPLSGIAKLSTESKTIIDSQVSLGTTPIRGSITLKNPFKNIFASYAVDGSVRNFKTQAKFTIGSTVMLDSEVAFQSNPINLDLTIKNPIRDIQATLSKSGPWTNFQSSAQLIVASETILDSDLSANVNPLQGSFNFKTPVKTLSGSIFVDGTYDHFDVKGELAVDGQSSFMNIQFKSDGGILGSASFAKGTQEIFSSKLSFETSPLRASLSLKSTNEYIKTLSASFSHKGKVLDFENQAEITINGEKTEAHMLFNIGSKSEMKISASSPYFPSIGLGLEFVGNAQKFQSAMEYSVGENTFSFDSSVDTTNGIDTFMTVKTPFEGYKTVTSKLSYNGIFPNSDGLIQIKTGRRTLLTGNFQLSNVKGISLKIVCQSVLTPALQISFDHSGDMQKFTTRAELRFNGTPFTTDISFQSTPYPQGSFAVVTPYMEPVTGSFNVEPQLNGNSINIKATFNGQPNSLDTSFYFGNDMGASFSMNSHVTGTIRGSVSLNRGYSSYTGSVNMEALGKKMTLDGKLNTERGIKSSISMTSPYGNSEAEFAYSGQYPNAKADLTVSMPGNKFSFNSEIQTQPKLSATLAISTPFSGYENVGGNIHFASNKDSVSFDTQINYLTGKQIAASFESTISGKNVQTVAKLETPYTEDLNIELTLTGQPSQFSKSLVVSMGEDNNLISTGTFSIGISSLNLDYSLKTTFAGYVDDQHIQVKYDADLPNFKASADAKILGSLYSTEASLDLSNEINALFKLDTPFEHLSDIAVTFEHSGTYRRFTTKSTVQAKNKSLFESNLQYSNYGWRRLSMSLDMTTPFQGCEFTKASYRHASLSDGFECDADISIMNKDISGTLTINNNPPTATVSFTTPFAGFEKLGADVKYVIGKDSINGQVNVAYMQDKTLSASIDMNSNSLTFKLSTPFQGYENHEVQLSYNGEMRNFQSTAAFTSSAAPSIRAQANLRLFSLLNLDGSVSLTSQIRNFENIKITVTNEENRGKYTTKSEISWSSSQSIVLDGTLTDNSLSTTGNINLRTPFDMVRQAGVDIKMEKKQGIIYSGKISPVFNGKTTLAGDITFSSAQNKALSVTMRSPITFSADVSGNIGRVYQGSVSFTNDIFEKNTGLTLTGTIDPIAKSVVAKYNCPTMQLDLNGSLKKSILVINTNRYGYEISESFAKIILPTRSLKVTGKVQNGATEGFLFWDADKDETKKVGFRSEIKSQSDSMKADMTVMLPSLGKDLQIDSEMILNRGRIIFDGKTELTYSKDSRKKITINSRVEDISSWDSRNYSFTFGISHPYTSVNVEVVSHVGNSNEKMTGAVDVKYLTARRETKQFTVNGELDKIRKGVELNIDTPMKKVGINGNIQAGSPYRLSLVNKYDNKKPLNTIVSFDSVKRSIDFQMNYDLENPTSELHVSAKYVNNSAIAAELYHVINRQRISDGLLALRLNSSHLLHSRIHWRPDMIADLKEYTAKKSSTYKRQLSSFADAVSESISAELRQKSSIINRSFMEESEPFVATATEQLERLAIMYELNQYHMRDIVDVVLAAAEKTKLKLHDMSLATSECMNNLSDELSKSMVVSKETIKNIILEVEKSSGMIMQSAENVYNIYSGHVYNITAPVMTSVNDKYNTYVNYMSQMSNDHMTNMADKYTSAIYGVNDAINTRVSRLLANKQVGGAYQHGYNAYKYWEIRENAEIIAQAIIDWIKEEIEIELSDIKATLLNLKKSTITVYDPKHGEIQAEIHLPLPIKTLDAVPVIEMDMSKTQKYIPKMPSISLPSSDVSKWLPPYEAIATIEGDTITTFDGLTYDLTKSCTFLLAKDNVNGNFTVVLNKENNNKTLVIIADGKAIELLADGQIKVDRQLTALPAVFRDTTMTSLNGHVKINVAGHLDVDYVKELDSYTIVMNGFYFGKTNGLLGSYDNEPYNDMMTSFGKPSDNADRFVKTWEVGTGKCR